MQKPKFWATRKNTNDVSTIYYGATDMMLMQFSYQILFYFIFWLQQGYVRITNSPAMFIYRLTVVVPALISVWQQIFFFLSYSWLFFGINMCSCTTSKSRIATACVETSFIKAFVVFRRRRGGLVN